MIIERVASGGLHVGGKHLGYQVGGCDGGGEGGGRRPCEGLVGNLDGNATGSVQEAEGSPHH